MMKTWKRDCCNIVEHSFDYDLHMFKLYALNGEYLGNITPGDIENYKECMTKLDAGDCPICDQWDDGLGNTCSLNGWGKATVAPS